VNKNSSGERENPMSKLLVHSFKLTLILLIPTLIILGSVRMLATEPYLVFEYSKTDFPDDPFGFDRAQRLAHGATNLKFVTQDKPLTFLSGQIKNGIQLYNSRELKHMQDVQNVYQATWRVLQIALTLAVLLGLALTWSKEGRLGLASALRSGGALTVGLVAAVGLGAIVAWQVWFVVFHQVFFSAGSWTFDFSDTLIRLFPEKFWYDAVLTISSLSLIAGSLVHWVGSRFRKVESREFEWFGNENPTLPGRASHQHGT
jgi:integral membrane protein (TIGR01906 family)